MYFFTYSYLINETHIYQCDFVEQNIFWHDFSILLKENFVKFIETLKNDIYYLNRNPVSVLPLIPFYFLFKDFRLGFIFSVELLYMLPVMILIQHIFYEYFIKYFCNNEETKLKKRKTLMILSSIFLFPILWHSVISGIADICGMIPILICYSIYFKYEFNKKIPFKILILFAFLLYVSFLLRRWYSVVIITFLTSIFIENIITSLKNSDKFKNIIFTIVNSGIISVLILLFANIFQGGYIKNIIKNELAERSVYSTDFNQLEILFGHLGLFISIISLIGLIFGLKNKLIRFSVINILIYLFTYLVIMNNQLLWINHFIYIAVLVCILFCSGLLQIVEFIKNKAFKTIFIIFIVIYNIFNFYTFFLIERPKQLEFLLPKTTAYPFKSRDYNKILKLYNYLEEEYNKNNNIKIVIYGLCNEIGYWQFKSINPDCKFTENLKERILDEAFEDAPYNEDIAIIFNPLGLYAPDKFNTKIKKVKEMFEQNKDFAKKYKKIQEIELTNEQKTKVTLYKRK